MADIRIKDLTTTASSSASDDFIAVDGTTNGTRKLNAFSPTFGGNVVVTGTLTSQSTLSTSAGLSCANATITQGYAILTGYGASADAGNLFLGQSSNGNFLNSSLTKIYTAIGGAEISNNVAAGFRVVTTTASTTTSTGALVVGNGTSGGLGVGGAIVAGGTITSTASTDSGLLQLNLVNSSTGTSASSLFRFNAGTRTATLQAYNDTHATLAGQLRIATSDGSIVVIPSGVTAATFTASGTTFAGAIAIGNTVSAGVAVASTHKVQISIGGTTYYLLASNV